jgi:hypothetical protein
VQLRVLTRRQSELFRDADYTDEFLAAEAGAVRRLYGEAVVRQRWYRGDVAGAFLRRGVR